VRDKLKTIGIAANMPNRYTTRPKPLEWQTDPFIWIVSGKAYP